MKIEIQEGFDNIVVIIKCPQKTEEVCKIETLLLGCKNKLACTKNGVTYLVDKNDVLFFESMEKNCFLYTVDGVFQISKKLFEIEEMLSEIGFLRTSKSQIINILKIESLCPDFGGRIEAIMENGYKLIISRQYAKQFKERMGFK